MRALCGAQVITTSIRLVDWGESFVALFRDVQQAASYAQSFAQRNFRRIMFLRAGFLKILPTRASRSGCFENSLGRFCGGHVQSIVACSRLYRWHLARTFH